MINVYIVSGFLGSGKTTFISKLLKEKKFEKVMLIENEFGEVGVDGGFSMAIPDGFSGLVIPRSGLAAKHGISVVNAPGLVDSGYRGEISVILLNTDNKESFDIAIGDRIAQMMIVPFANAELIESDTLDTTERSEKGFGSSGR